MKNTHLPVIGIIANHAVMSENYPVHASGIINTQAIVEASGGMPIIIPADPDFVTVPQLMAVCDGFLLTGGRPNVHPSAYGEEATPEHGTFDQARDAITLPLIRACIEAGQPFLGVCRGFQEVNVAMGGGLHPEIRNLPGRINHRMPLEGSQAEKYAHRHAVNFTPGGVFSRLMGQDSVMTNSLHGQGIARQIGARICIDGWASDGTPEALYIEDAPGFTLCVQWHPEWQAAQDPVSRPLFAAFGQAARDWAAAKR